MNSYFKKIRFSYRQRLLFKYFQYWMQRHPLAISPRRRAISKNSPRVLLNSFPKAGTNLLSALFCAHPAFVSEWSYHLDDSYSNFDRQLRSQRGGQPVTLHSKWRPFWRDYLVTSDQKMVFVTRDLRDIAVSNFHYILKDKSHRLHRYFLNLPNDRARLQAAMEGIPSSLLGGAQDSLSLRQHAEGYLGWLKEERCLVVRFEDLVGSRGGGDGRTQTEVLKALFKYVGLDATEKELRSVADRAISPQSRTFRKGQIGDWQNHFDTDALAWFDRECGSLLRDFGYT